MTATRQSLLGHLRVLDLGTITAGAATSQMLADMGADVIKIESPTNFDMFRRWTQVAASTGGQPNLDQSPPFQTTNRNKRGVGIDLKHPKGRAIFLDLVAKSDVVVENFSRGVLERLGIAFEALKAANPKIVLASLSSQGQDGPEAGYMSFGSTLEALGGLMSVMGYDADRPRWTGTNVNFPDQLVSILAPGVILAALRQRDLTGDAIHLDFSQRESVTFLLGEQVIAASSEGRQAPPIANRHLHHAPQGIYPCRGTEQWIAITVTSDAEWLSLCEVLGLDSSTRDPRFLTVAGRLEHHETLDGLLASATALWSRDELDLALSEAHAAVSCPVLNAAEVLEDPQIAVLGILQTVESPSVASHRQRGFAGRFSRTPCSVRRPAPKLGEHSREVLAQVAGYAADRIDTLIAESVVYQSSEGIDAADQARGK